MQRVVDWEDMRLRYMLICINVQADWKDSFKKKQAGVSDMTLLSTITEDAINDNLKKRFENAEIYVSVFS